MLKEVYDIKRNNIITDNFNELEEYINDSFKEDDVKLVNKDMVLESDKEYSNICDLLNSIVYKWIDNSKDYQLNLFYSILPISKNKYIILFR